MQLRRHPNRAEVSRAVPGGAHAKRFTQRRQLPRQGQAADLAEMNPDVIDQPSEIKSFHSRGLLNSSPIASGTAV